MAEAEAILLRRFTATGDAEAFAEIIRCHAGLVYGAAMRILADMDRAADVAQETFLQLAKDAPRVSGSLAGWLHRVATHKAIDQMRREASRKRCEAEYVGGPPQETSEWKELSRYVDEELNNLDEQTRDVLIAHFLESRTTRQIAAAQGVSQATVSRRVDAGVTRLRVALRRRGVLVAAGALSAMLGENAAQAAPAAVMMELGKIALVGAPAASVSVSAAHVVTTGLRAGVTAKVAVVAAVAVIGTGSVVTYQHAAGSRSSENTVVTRSPVSRTPSRTVSSSGSAAPSPAPRASAAGGGPSAAAQQWNDLINTARSQAGAQTDQQPMLVPQGAAAPVIPTIRMTGIPTHDETHSSNPRGHSGVVGECGRAALSTGVAGEIRRGSGPVEVLHCAIRRQHHVP
jgi:RNA polymerase sigma factor (sigma-70 family)